MTTFFQPSELACHCGRPNCDAAPMDPVTLIKLTGLRLEMAEPMKLTSARRCEYQNRLPTVRGAKDSQHLYGRAVDCWCPDAAFRFRLMQLSIKHGFRAFGTGKTFLHMDTRDCPKPLLFASKC